MKLNVGTLRADHDRFLSAHSAMVAGVMYDAGVVALAEVAVHSGFKPESGKLQQATTTRVIRTSGGKLLRISNARPYARAIELGAKPHKIVARKSKFLRFYGKGGGLTFRRSVNHPGNRPYWFLRNATQVAASRAELMLLAGMQRVARNAGR